MDNSLFQVVVGTLITLFNNLWTVRKLQHGNLPISYLSIQLSKTPPLSEINCIVHAWPAAAGVFGADSSLENTRKRGGPSRDARATKKRQIYFSLSCLVDTSLHSTVQLNSYTKFCQQYRWIGCFSASHYLCWAPLFHSLAHSYCRQLSRRAPRMRVAWFWAFLGLKSAS